tara:strand:- start:289 stop:1077 length:789 start_codon:yes stop_codon:yes gene_type:complete
MIKVKIIKNSDNSYCPIPTRNRKVNEANKAEAAEDPDIKYGYPDEMPDDKRCGNCAAFNVSENMIKCGGASEDRSIGYCMMHEFTCAAEKSCLSWAPGGPKTEDSLQEDLLTEKCWPGYEKKGMKKMFGKMYPNCVKKKRKKKKKKNEQLELYEADPKKGTGKKPKGSGRRLYTDENPKDTVSVKFSTVQDIKDTLSKKSFKSKSHKRQSQIINLIHQRARAAYQNAKDPKVKARLKKSFEYAKKRKEASKRKTQRMNKSKK